MLGAETIIGLDQVRVVYHNKDGDRIGLDGVTLEIGRESVALLGPNGAGKSTLMGVLSGTLKPESGMVDRTGMRGGLGMVFQTTAIDELLTVRENLVLAGALHSMDRKGIGAAVESMAGTLGIGDRLDQQVRHLSGGLKRKADLARALLPGPGLLLLDEPTSGLDVEARASLWSAIDSIRSKSPMGVVYATHLTEEARRADRVVMIADGKIVVDGSPDDLIGKLGAYVLRVRCGDDQTATVVEWCTGLGRRVVHRGGDVLIADAQPEDAARCAEGVESVTLAAPTLEDVYLWHARSGYDTEAVS